MLYTYIYIIVQLIRNLEICEVYIILSLSFYKYLNKKVLKKNDLLYIYIKKLSTQTCITNDVTCVIIISDSNNYVIIFYILNIFVIIMRKLKDNKFTWHVCTIINKLYNMELYLYRQ